jgi:dolichol-phosphate mannosyltransferase
VRNDAERTSDARRRLFLVVFTLAPLSVFVVFSLVHDPKLNWTGPLWLAALPAVAWLMGKESRWPTGRLKTFLQHSWTPTFVVTLILLGGLLHYLTLGLPGIPYPPRMGLPVAWDEFGQAVAGIEDALNRQSTKGTGQEIGSVVGMDKYMLASEIAFYGHHPGQTAGKQMASQNLFGGDGLMYAWWSPAAAYYGQRLLLVSFRRWGLADQRLAPWVEKMGPVQEQIIRKGGRPVTRFYFRVVRYGRHPAVPDL